MPKKLVLLSVMVLLVSVSSAKDKDKEKFQQPGPVRLDKDGEKWTEKTLRKLSLEDKVAQMFMVWARAEFLNLASSQYISLRDTIHKFHPGGIALSVRAEGPFLYRNQPYEAAMLTNQLQREAAEAKPGIPLVIAADFERGVSMRLYGTTVFPHAMAFGATGKTSYAQDFGRISAQEARAVGVQWNFFPVADVNSNPANPIINTRAFGEDPQQVGDLVAAYIQGAQANGLLTTAKHFPGHGDTETDSHLGFARVGGDQARLQSVELPPFRRAIAAGVDSVMVAHVTVPALEPDPNRVGTTSPKIVDELLKRQLGFHGLVITDAMEMQGLTRLYTESNQSLGRAAVDAVKAGNDMLLVPLDLQSSINAIVAAVNSGEISQSRIDDSVRKILHAKAAVGLHKGRLVDLSTMDTVIAKPENVALGQQVADDAVTLVRDNRQVLPLQAQRNGTTPQRPAYGQVEQVANRVVAVVFSDDVRTEAGRVFERQLRARIPDANVIFLDPRYIQGMSEQVLQAVEGAQAVIAAIYVVPTAGKAVNVGGAVKNTVALAEAPAALLHGMLQRAGQKTVVVALGNPYLAGDFPEVQNYMCTFSNATVSELSAVKALFGEIPVHGKLPVSIPNIAQRGSGIERPQEQIQAASARGAEREAKPDKSAGR